MRDYGSKRANADSEPVRYMEMCPGLPSRHFLTDLPIHTHGGWDHYIKGWVQRRTKGMVFLWCTCQEQFNPQFGDIIRNFIGHQLELNVVLVSPDLCTCIILTLAFLMFICYYFGQRSPSPQRPLQAYTYIVTV